jgi:hypothetical protein
MTGTPTNAAIPPQDPTKTAQPGQNDPPQDQPATTPSPGPRRKQTEPAGPADVIPRSNDPPQDQPHPDGHDSSEALPLYGPDPPQHATLYYTVRHVNTCRHSVR